MITIEARNVNDALWSGANIIRQYGVQSETRNGPVLVLPGPVSTFYTCPQERVLFNEVRDANPFFHLVESLWMIAGRNDLKALTPYVADFGRYSDDGKTVPGAYGHRWRNHFLADSPRLNTLDQLAWAIRRLKEDPTDRRVVIQMYDAETDQPAADRGGKDIPCNLMALPAIVDGKLNLTVFNRSNDMVWGAYGANAVHFSVLQEYLAAMIGVPMGYYWQVANNYHAYLSTLDKAPVEWPWGVSKVHPTAGQPIQDPYGRNVVRPMDMFSGQSEKEILEDINMFFEDPARIGIRSPFLRKVACPMVMAHRAFKANKKTGILDASEILEQIPADNDWRVGATLWLTNRARSRSRAADDGVNHAAENQNGAAG